MTREYWQNNTEFFCQAELDDFSAFQKDAGTDFAQLIQVLINLGEDIDRLLHFNVRTARNEIRSIGNIDLIGDIAGLVLDQEG